MSSMQDSPDIDQVTSYLSQLSLKDSASSGSVEAELPPDLKVLWESGRIYLKDSLEDGAGSGRRFLNSAYRHILNSSLPRDSIPPGLRAALFQDGGANGWQRRQPLPNNQLDELMLKTDITTFLLCACEREQPPAAIETIAEQQKRLDEAFHVKFRGRFDELFVEALDIYAKIYDNDIYYGRMIPFVQASGTGKTRLAWELGHRMPAFCVCFREDELPTSGWPPRDVNRKFFDGLDGPSTFLAEEKAAAFLGALVEVLHKTAPADLEGWIKAWSIENPTDLDGSSRHSHFEDVKKLTTERLTAFKEELFTLRSEHNITVSTDAAEADDNAGDEESGTSVTRWHQHLFRILAKPAFDKLADSVQRLGYQRFLLSLDECTELNDPALLRGPKGPRGPQRKMSLIALQRIIKAADEFSFPHGIQFWYMLLDTNSSVYELASSGPDASSFRLTSALKPLPVFCYVDFDQMRYENKQDDKRGGKRGGKQDDQQDGKIINAEDALLISFLATLGRPYWYSLRNTPEVVRAAIKKLIYNDAFDPANPDHVFAIFANRIVLELSNTSHSSRIAINAVRSHMRLLTDVHDAFIITEAPSEPMLAVAAAQILNENSQNYAKALDTLMRRLIIDGVVTDRGRQGELSVRLLLTLARDKATLPDGGKFVDSTEPTRRAVRPVKLSDFLKTLLGKDLGIKIQNTTEEATTEAAETEEPTTEEHEEVKEAKESTIEEDEEPTTQKTKAQKAKALKAQKAKALKAKAQKAKADAQKAKAEAQKAKAEQAKAEKAKAEKTKTENVRRLLKGAEKVWINFTHWIQTPEEISVITLEWLAELWFRGAAVQCTHNQALLDMLFVTYSGDLSKPFDKKKLGYAIKQIKARTDASGSKLVAGLAGPIIETTNASGEAVRYKPENYVAIFMDFASESAIGHAGGPRVAIEFGKPDMQKHSNWIGYLGPEEPERYCLNIRGHDSQVYTVITPEFKEQFDLLFAHAIAPSGPFEKYAHAMKSAMDPISSRLHINPVSLKAEKKAERAPEKAPENAKAAKGNSKSGGSSSK
ncbi:uncharacterized protein LAESUDRAFT_732907 [Laetiporus sulphureus 93-53]|uniref:Uncharacterized protein n=1 Tax=Laetiporus sulphureus 93-53 TaxID=1314785 RepID=A0A165AVL9_9APHY|nr:uncharacterized protein LAESUDRAFT_732907 [Laetiporus sulphureus 93-53]KZS99750.1 hypothetical protein LAESUDRAFT_732907 [Laetiporus sulphureus 93-53]